MGYRHWLWPACWLLVAALVGPAGAFDEDHKAQINGTTLHFRVRGADRANPYLLILHGGPGFSAHMFYPWGASLEKSLNVVYLDQRGGGESARLTVADPAAPKPEEIKGYTVAALIQDIEGVREALKVDRWFVLGHAWGGMLGLEYVAAHPEHVLGYIHMDGLVSVPLLQQSLLDKEETAFTSRHDTAALARVKALRALPPDSPARLTGALGLAMGPAALYFARDQEAAFHIFNLRVAQAAKAYGVPAAAVLPAPEPLAALIANDHFLARDDRPLLSKITVPVLILNGAQDGVITPAMAEAAHAALPDSHLVLLDDCGHFPFVEQPEKTTAAVLTLVATQSGRPTGPAEEPLPFEQEAGPVGDYAAVVLPATADPARLAGRKTVVTYTIDEAGRPRNVQVTQTCGQAGVDRACVASILKTAFRPTVREGVPQQAQVTHTFNFQ